MASAYKWRLTHDKYAYLTDTTSANTPIVSVELSIDEESIISQKVVENFATEEAYSAQYELMKSVIASDPDEDVRKVSLLSYKYYYDVSDTTCGFLQDTSGPKGDTGEKGERGDQGPKGDTGRGIENVTITDLEGRIGKLVTIIFSDGQTKSFEVLNGGDGVSPNVDYSLIMSGITGMDLPSLIESAVTANMFELLSEYCNRLFSGVTSDIETAKSILSGLTDSVEGISLYINSMSGEVQALFEYYNQQSSSVTEIQRLISAYSGIVSTDMEYVDTLTSSVTLAGRYMLVVSGLMGSYIERIDDLSQQVTGFTEQVDIIDGEYYRMLWNLTRDPVTSGEVITLSEIRQRADIISAITTNSNGIAAGIILAINNDTSDATIFADHIKLIGYDIELGSEDGTHSLFNANGSGYLANGNIAWNSNGDMTINGSVIANAVSGITMQFGGADGTPSAVFNADGSGYLANGKIAWESDGDTIFDGEIIATKGTIGGFQIASDHIGVAATPSQEVNWANLSMYKDFFKVGGTYGYAMLGDDVIPSSAGGAFTATGRIVNGHPNSGAYWGFDQANYGLFISVSGGTKNYGISSNAALKAPAFVNTEVELLNFSGSTYRVDFSQHTIYLLYATNDVNVNLPGESSVASSFGVSNLPDNFGALVTFRVRTGSKSITLKGVYNWNEELTDHTMEAGDTCELLITKADGFRYQVLGHDS